MPTRSSWGASVHGRAEHVAARCGRRPRGRITAVGSDARRCASWSARAPRSSTSRADCSCPGSRTPTRTPSSPASTCCAATSTTAVRREEALAVIADVRRCPPRPAVDRRRRLGHGTLPGRHADPPAARPRSCPIGRRTSRTVTATGCGSTPGRWSWPGSRPAPRTPWTAGSSASRTGPLRHAARGRRRRWSGGSCPGRAGRAARGLRVAQDILFSLGITSWQDAAVGEMFGQRDVLQRLHRSSARPGRCGARGRGAVVGPCAQQRTDQRPRRPARRGRGRTVPRRPR